MWNNWMKINKSEMLRRLGYAAPDLAVVQADLLASRGTSFGDRASMCAKNGQDLAVERRGCVFIYRVYLG